MWPYMVSHVRKFVRPYLHRVGTRAGAIVPCPNVDTLHGTGPGKVVHFEFSYVGRSGSERASGSHDGDGFQ